MTLLANFPYVNQNTSVTGDGRVSNNGLQDCVAASLCAACMWLNGVTEVGGKYTPDSFKDAAYSEGYQGGTAASAYAAYCASLGVHLYPISDIPGNLVNAAREQLVQGHPVVFTESDPWVDVSLPQYHGWTHVCVFIGEDTGGLTSYDPYGVKTFYKSDATWANTLLFQQIWVLEKVASPPQKVEVPAMPSVQNAPTVIEITDAEVSKFFELGNADGSQWRCRQTGCIIQGAILEFYRAYVGNALCGLTYLGLPLSNERTLVGGTPSARRQYFERGVLAYDPTHSVDNPPGSGNVYLLNLYSGVNGQDPMIAQLENQVATLTAQVAAAQSGNPAELDAAKAKIAKAVADLS